MTAHESRQSGYLNQSRHNVSGLAIIIALHGAVLATAFLAKSGVVPAILDGRPAEVVNVLRPDPPPPQPSERIEPEVVLPHIPTVSDPVIELPQNRDLVIDTPAPPLGPPIPGSPTVPQPQPDPVVRDARFANMVNVQPRYPSALLRQDLEGSCTIRVRIAPNGRVTAAEPVNATHPAFCEATQRHALRRWRFEPATRDGVPVESWQRHTVEFRIS